MPEVISSVKALLKHNGKFLILREDLHHGPVWDLPGGKIEYGESPKETLIREIKEELGLEIKIIKSVGVWYFFSQTNQHQVICHTFLVEPVEQMKIDTNHNPADEHFSELKWLTIEDILNSNEVIITDSLRELLTNLQSPKIKLIRDKIPELAAKDGNELVTRELSKEEFVTELKKKLVEEAREVGKADTVHMSEELADCMEVINKIVKINHIEEEVERKKQEKVITNGGFEKRLLLVGKNGKYYHK